MKRAVWSIGLLALAALVGAELFLRFAWGLANPALYVEHPSIEYQFRPGQEVRVFGNRIAYNELSMRSPPLGEVAYGRLVLAFGDSVVNGQIRSDQADLATALASRAPDGAGNSVLFGNVSARSWGPANISAWIDQNGFQGADTAIFVLSSHDLTDHPTFAPLDPETHPTRNPPLALIWPAQKILNRLMPTAPAAKPEPSVLQARMERGIDDFEAMIDRVAEAGLRACLVYHLTRGEIAEGPEPAHPIITGLFARRGLPVVELAPMIVEMAAADESVFKDNIHITSRGQAVLAEALLDCDRLAQVPGQ